MFFVCLVVAIAATTFIVINNRTKSNVIVGDSPTKPPANNTVAAPVYELKTPDDSDRPIGNSVLPSTQ